MVSNRFGLTAALCCGLALAMGCGGGGGGGGGGNLPTPGMDYRLGPVYDAGTGTATFRVWAPKDGSATVKFFDGTGHAVSSYPMSKDLTGGGADLDKQGWNGVWVATVPSVTSGQLYQYDIGGRAALDPYAPSMGQFDSSTQSVGMGAVLDPETVDPDGGWAAFTAPTGYAKRTDAVVYEVHVRDWTITIPQAQLQNPPGSYLAFTERLDHIKDLGVTHIQLLPVQAYYYGDESKRNVIESTPSTSNNNYNWGYDPQSWYAPEGMYSANPTDPLARVRELKTLVNEAHKKGLGVTLDVVYNHTASTSILDALVPGYYYRGTNHSGVGNDTASERKMMGKLIIDSIAYWTKVYHVDGFRFDLMGLIDSLTMTRAFDAAHALNPYVLFLGEGWNMGADFTANDQGEATVPAVQGWMTHTNSIGVFSDSFRNDLKGGYPDGDVNFGFVTSASPLPGAPVVDKGHLFSNLIAEPTNFTADDPGDSVQYMTAHDGLTLHDKIAKIVGLNPATQEAEIMKLARAGWVLQATAQGTSFIHAGCEMGRTKSVSSAMGEATPSGTGSYFVYNSYDSSDAVNAIKWDTYVASGSPQKATYDYASGLFALRRSTDAFRLPTKALVDAHTHLVDGTKPYAIAYRASDSAGTFEYVVFVNVGTTDATLATGSNLTSGTVVVVDQNHAGTDAIASPAGYSNLTGTAITIAPRTAIVFKRALPQ